MLVRSLSGKDRDKADKVSISFPATPRIIEMFLGV